MAEQSIQLTKLASCAGCGAKVGAGVLAQLLGGLKVHSDPRLLVGFDKSDDASVYQVTDELALVQTVDFFPPIADDPYLFGQIAATNALSDVYAMGGEPKLALNLLCIPESMPKEAVHQLLRGGYDKAYEAGVIITGGHSILDPEPKYGLAVTGFVHPKKLVGFDKSDDASVYQVTDELALVQTVDFFPPIADDPYLFGQIAATNALSDVYAMGGEPKLALNLLCIPESMPKEAVHQLLRGGYDKAYEAGVIITGGHSILDPEPKYGLAVTGFVHPKKLLTNSAARPGDVLLLTKPLGIGVLTTAAKAGLASPEAMALAHRLMTTLNKAARDCMVRYAVHACTDVTGFGLLGHAFEMAQGSDTHLMLFPGEIDLIPEALEFARDGILPAGMYRNRHYAEAAVDPGSTELAVQDMLYDPQTSGGLLIAAAPEDADALLRELRGAVPSAQRIGVVEAYNGGPRISLR